jgi:predicted nucleotidyltransferase
LNEWSENIQATQKGAGMDKRTIGKVIKYLESRLAENGVIVSQIILFGSQAKRNSSKDSDIDLIIVSDSFRRKGFLKRVDMASRPVGDTIRHFHVPIDVLLKSPDEVDNEYLERIGGVVFAA